MPEEKQGREDLLRLRLKKLREVLPKSKMFFSFISNALENVVEFEIGFESALIELEAGTKQGYLELEKMVWTEGIRKKFSELLFLDRMIHITGNFSFREEIMRTHIQSLFAKQQGLSRSQLERILENLSRRSKV